MGLPGLRLAVKLTDGFASSGFKCAERLREYTALAEAGLWATLVQKMDANTLDSDAHPNGVLLAAITVMAAQAKGRRSSNVPAVQAYREHLTSSPDQARAQALGLHIPEVVG